jgi:hypothetical protein
MESFNDVIENIYNLRHLFDNVQCERKRMVMTRMFMKHLEAFVNKMEETYYKKVIRNKSVSRLKSYQEIEIERTYKTMDVFLPFIIAYQLAN